MKKTLIALAALASVSAFAQSSVTISGTVAMGYSKGFDAKKGINQTDGNVFFSGTEDLGGGLKASFKTGFDLGARNAPSSEDSSLALSGDFGTVTAKVYESHGAIENVLLSGSYLVHGYGDVTGSGDVVTKNRGFIGYTSNPMNNVSYTLAYVTKVGATNALYASNDSSNNQNGNKLVLAAKYAAGPLTAYAEYDKFDSQYGGTSSITGKSNDGATAYTLYGIYDAGVAKFGLGYGKQSNDVGLTLYGVSVPMGAVTVGLDGSSYHGRRMNTVGASYALSKRTSFKASYGNMNADLKAVSGMANSSEYRIALVHNF